MELLRELDKKQLYVTDTVMKNRIPKELTIAKSLKEFKLMKQGDVKRHLYKFITADGEDRNYGLVNWKDRDIVYCMTSAGNTNLVDTCCRRSNEGLLNLTRPQLIADYNRYMGGVDLADMRRLHCNSTIMGQHRWWLKLFFYLLDVGTANALVLFRESMNNESTNKMSIVEYKSKLVNLLVGDRISKPIVTTPTVHKLVRQNRRHICAYCAIFSKNSRTRYRCAVSSCNLPLCCVGNGKAELDCFAKAHASDEMHRACLDKHAAMLLKTNNRGGKK